MKQKQPGGDPGCFRSPVLTQRGRLVAKQERRIIKATFSLDVGLVARLNACATIRNTSRDALVTAALEEAVRGLILFDKGKPSRRSVGSDRPVPEDSITSDGENEPAEGPGLTIVPNARAMASNGRSQRAAG